MEFNELALVIYTILMQLAVGSFITIELIRFFSTRKSTAQEANNLVNLVLYSLGPIAVLGMLASFFHLKVPLLAPYALLNVGTSWMSREIWLTLIFTVLVIVYSILLIRKLKSQLIKNIFAIVTSLVGLVLIYCMARAYMLPTFPAWDSLATPFSFYVTTLLLGTVFCGAAIAFNYRHSIKRDPDSKETQYTLLKCVVKWITLAAVVALGVELVSIPLHQYYLALAEIPSAALYEGLWAGGYGVLFALRLVLVFIGAGILGFFMYRNAVRPDQELRIRYLIYVAFTLVLVSELFGRFLFYATSIKIGI